MCVCVCVFTNPSAQEEYDTKSIFKQSWTGLNSEFSFSYTGNLTKAKESILSYYLLTVGVHFPKSIKAMSNAISLIQDLNLILPCPFPMPITITPYICSHQPISLVSRVFTNGPRNLGSIPGWVISKTQKMVLDTYMLNTQHYKV